MELMLTPDRIFEAAPLPQWRRQELLRLWDTAPNTDTSIIRTYEAFWYLWKWYMFEQQEIGEARAFWGVVYRLCDDPTKKDVQIIRKWMDHNYRSHWGYFDNPVVNISIESMQERAEVVVTMKT
jgi:hypothetical protein